MKKILIIGCAGAGKSTLARLMSDDKWILDGNFDSSLEIRMQPADTVIYLDFPLSICLSRVVRRWLKYRGTHRPDMSPGCNEKLDWEFLKWILMYRKSSAPHIRRTLEANGAGKNIKVLKSPSEVASFLSELN